MIGTLANRSGLSLRIILLFIFIIGGFTKLTASEPSTSIINITRSINVLELNPNFCEPGGILYMEATNQEGGPEPWDYRIMLTDFDGNETRAVTGSGIVDYIVLPGQTHLLAIVSRQVDLGSAVEVDFYHSLTSWQLRRIDIETGNFEIIENSMGRPLTAAYEKLGVVGLTNWEREAMTTVSPSGKNKLYVQREVDKERSFIRFYKDANVTNVILEAESFYSHTHHNWLPPVVWINEQSFITLLPDPGSAEAVEHNRLFSIVKYDMDIEQKVIIHRSASVKKYPSFSLNVGKHFLFFQEWTYDGKTRLCCLNLINNEVTVVFETRSELGEARISFNCASLLVTRVEPDNWDILRIDLLVKSGQGLASNWEK